MKKWVSILAAIILCLGILTFVSADVNEGYGPGYEVTEEEGAD
jgi:hypothetical protein